jgi:phosphonate transport system permease protein
VEAVWRSSPTVRTSLIFLAVAVACLAVADIAITTVNPWIEMGRLVAGIFTPNFFATENLGMALLFTVAFAILGVAIGNFLGFLLALVFHSRAVRVGCAFVRAVHELFWALIFLQIFGLSPLTGILAIAIPYAGIIAKVYAEILEEANKRPLQAVPAGSSRASVFLFVRLPDVWAHFKNYSMYRLECGLRSSAVLGFVGLPTLGFYLETAFRQGQYSEVSALLILFYVIIASMRVWMRKPLLPAYILISLLILPWGAAKIESSNIVRFFTQDIVPYPIRNVETIDGEALTALWTWFENLLVGQAIPGAIDTLLLTMIALVGSGLLALAFFPLISPLFYGRFGRSAGHLFLVVVRSTPEYILAYIFLQLWGPSMLPAIVALALHNGAIIGHLVGRYTEEMKLRLDAARGLNLYAYEVTPRLYGQLLAFLFYRWEVILRETAILGILGIATLGFYIDSAFADIRADRALFLILLTALLNIGVDALSRAIRARLHLRTTIEQG